MAKATLTLIVFITALASSVNSGQPHQQTSERALTTPTIKVTIATVSSSLGPPTDRYKVGDQIPVIITMTNTSTGPLNACVSSDLYQNLPKLSKDGQLVPYMKWQSYERLNAARDHVCQDLNVPDTVLLRPSEPKKADWFVLVDSGTSTGAEAWYDPLPAGKYELTIQRRFGCCEGPMVESNKINFEVVP